MRQTLLTSDIVLSHSFPISRQLKWKQTKTYGLEGWYAPLRQGRSFPLPTLPFQRTNRYAVVGITNLSYPSHTYFSYAEKSKIPLFQKQLSNVGYNKRLLLLVLLRWYGGLSYPSLTCNFVWFTHLIVTIKRLKTIYKSRYTGAVRKWPSMCLAANGVFIVAI